MKQGFRRRIMNAILIVAAVGVSLVTLISYTVSKQKMEQNYIYTLSEKMSLEAQQFDEMMKDLYLSVQKVSHREDVREQIVSYLEGEKSHLDSMNFAKMLKSVLEGEDSGYALWLYIPEAGQLFSTLEYYPVQTLSSSYLNYWRQDEGSPYVPLFYMNVFAHSSKHVYAYARPIYDDRGERLAMVSISMDERQLYYNLLGSLNSSGNETYMLLDETGKVASSRQAAMTRLQISQLKEKQTDRMNAQIGTDGLLYTSVEAPFSGYRIMCSSDLKQLTSSLRNIILLILFVAVAVLVIVAGVSVILSSELYRPIRELVTAMDRVKDGDFSVRVKEEKNDEFGIVQEHFNEMADQMDRLTEEVVSERVQKKEAEINALQYQIRPHFMYNTLNSIRFAAVMQGNQKLAGLLQDYIALLEASIQRRGAFITFKDEIELVKNYLSLQMFRYADCFECSFEIEKEVEACYVPCLILQPLVENAVFHGIDPKRNDNRLTICGWMENGFLNIKICDNGSGFKVETEADKSEKRRFTGIGLNNIQERLDLYYGSKAGFTINSQLGEGTTVVLRIPVSYDPEEYSI